MLIDSHCHLDYFHGDELAAVLARARDAGVGEMVSISTRLDQAPALIALAAAHAQLWCTIGVHPHHVAEAPLAEEAALVALAAHPKVIGIGESGLDYFYDRAPRPRQQESFRIHIRAARASRVPLVIHARDADEDIAAILREESEEGGAFAFLLHCFSSGRDLAETALALGGYVSFSGMLTFPKSEAIRDIARAIPAERLLVETDAPYLAPVPHRGKRNEPALVVHTARKLAEIRGLSQDALACLTVANFRRLFTKTG